MIFKLPWKILAASPPTPPVVPVIEPNEVVAAPGLGGPLELGLAKLGWFNTLNASMRRSKDSFSLIGKTREILLSNCQNMGPFREFLPVFPKVPKAEHVVTEVDVQTFAKAVWLR